MEKYCFFVPEDCLQMRITKTQGKYCMPEPNYMWHGQIQFFNYFSHIQNNEKQLKRQQVSITHLNSLSAVDCNRIILQQEFSDSSKYLYPNPSSSNFSINFANFKVLKSACPWKSKGQLFPLRNFFFPLQLISKPSNFQTRLFKYENFCFHKLISFFTAISLMNDLCKDLLR